MASLAVMSVRSYGQCNFNYGPVGELCTSAIYICGDKLDGYMGRLPEELSVDQPWTGVCDGNGTADNIIWFSFTPCGTTVTIEITTSNCTLKNNKYIGVQAGLFDACNGSASIACTDNSNGNGVIGTVTLTATGVVPGIPLYLFLDGYAGSVCDFKIRVIEGIDTTPVTMPDVSTLEEGAVTGRNLISCEELNKPVTYNLLAPECKVVYNSACSVDQNAINVADSVCFVWKVAPVQGRYFSAADSVGRSTQLVFTEPGTYTISVDSYMHPLFGGSCASGACGRIQSWTVTVSKPDTIVNPVEYICPGNTRTYCGTLITSDTTVYCDEDPCNIVVQPFIFGTSKENIMGTLYICTGSAFDFQGVSYSTPGTYLVVDATDCALVHHFEVETVDISVSIQATDTELNCKKPTITIGSNSNNNGPLPLEYRWYDETGIFVSSAQTLQLNSPGKYRVQAIYDAAGINCSTEDEIIITSDFTKPKVQAFKPTVKCRSSKDPQPVLTLSTTSNLDFAEWTLPSGAKQLGLNVIVDSLGAVSSIPYMFTAIGNNGCRLDTSFTLETNFEKAIVTLTGDDLTCLNPIDTIVMSTNILIDSVRWYQTLPQQAYYGSFVSKKSHEVTSAGTYKVEARASSSRCWSEASVAIADRIKYPSLTVGVNEKWNCNTNAIEVLPLTETGQNFSYSWTTTNGQIASQPSDLKMVAQSPGTYRFQVTDNSNGCQKFGSVTIEEEKNKPYNIKAVAEDVLCFGESNGVISILGQDGGFGPYSYYLDGRPATSTEITGLGPGVYQLEVRDKYDCRHNISLQIEEPDLLEVETPLEITIAFTEQAYLSYKSNYPDNEIVSSVWTNAAGDVIGTEPTLDFSTLSDETVIVELTTMNGCIARSQIKIHVDNELKIFYPNIFSPNGDGNNDRFIIFKNGIPANINKLAIYDRLGNMVYSNDSFVFNDNDSGWDGTFLGRPVENGVYVMVMEYSDFAGVRHLVRKDITVAR